MPHFLVGANVAGGGLRERLRSTTFAFFGLVTATGLVLVGIAYNQGWPDFVNSPIPGIPIQRVGEARIAAGAAHTIGSAGRAAASHRSASAGKAQLVPGRSSGHHVTSQQQAPVAVSGGQVRGPAPSGHGGVNAPAPPAPAPVAPPPQATAQPPAAQPPAAQSPAPDPVPAKETAPVATSPPTSKAAAPVPGNGKAKGHEKSHGTSTAPDARRPKGAQSARDGARATLGQAARGADRTRGTSKGSAAAGRRTARQGPRLRPLQVTLGQPGGSPAARSRLGRRWPRNCALST